MLAQNFKTAADLGIRDAELASLVAVLGMLERGELEHEQHYRSTTEPGVTFNMATWHREHDCGTVCCIGGAAQIISGAEWDVAAITDRGRAMALAQLFYPIGYDMALITTEQAAQALRSYLTTGNARWGDVPGLTRTFMGGRAASHPRVRLPARAGAGLPRQC